MTKPRRELEREISQAIIRFEKEFMGRGPLETRAYIIEDMVVVRLKNVLTPAEFKLAEGLCDAGLAGQSARPQVGMFRAKGAIPS